MLIQHLANGLSIDDFCSQGEEVVHCRYFLTKSDRVL